MNRSGNVTQGLDHYKSWLDSSRRNYVKRTFAYLSHKWRRRSVNAQIRNDLAEILKPGDVLITRHDLVLTNLFLPGYWPHAALYIGKLEQRHEPGIQINILPITSLKQPSSYKYRPFSGHQSNSNFIHWQKTSVQKTNN